MRAEGFSLALLSDLEVGSFLIYIPRPTTDDARRWKDVVLRVKNDAPSSIPGESMTAFAIRRLREELPGSVLEPFFGPDVFVVPAPKSSVLLKGALWPTMKLCERMVAEGLAGSTLPCLERTEPVPKAAFAAPGARPTSTRHYETIRVRGGLGLQNARLLLVDDVVTRGATLLACASHLQEAFPDARIQAFALARTLSYVGDAPDIVDPHISRIRPTFFGDADRYDEGAVEREP